MTDEINELLRDYEPTARTRAGIPWAFVARAHGGIAVYVWKEQERCMPETTLRALYGLTPQQARTAQLLFGRRTNHEISEILGVTVHTARRHVEAVLFKLKAESRFDVETILCRAAVEGMRVAYEGE